MKPGYVPARPLVNAIDRAVDRRDKIASMMIDETCVSGFIDVYGAGEAGLEIMFPVWFTERPVVTFGGELGNGHSPETGNFPTVSGVILYWKFGVHGYTNYYAGAAFGLVTTGKADQELTVHWRAEGKALRNPRANIPGADDEF